MTKAVLGSAVALVCCAAAPLAAQQAAPTSKPAHNVFVLSGCLTAAEDATEIFKLTDASSIGQAPPPESRAVGTTGQKVSYELRPATGVNAQGLNTDALKAHVGERVEVTVRPVETIPASPTPATGSAQSTKPAEPAPERFTVTEIKRVSGTCS